MNEEKFWKIRSEKYNNLQWVNNKDYLSKIIKIGKFKKRDTVLDVGCGTGIMTHKISPLVKEVIGMDISSDMMEHSNLKGNKYFVRSDIRESLFSCEVFDKIVARMVFHHIKKNRIKAFQNCYYMLKDGGSLIIAEGVPPTNRTKKFFTNVFKLKEDRVTLTSDQLINEVERGFFLNVVWDEFIMEKFSIKNWLQNSGLPIKTQKQIYNMHLQAPAYVKEDYNMKITKNDIFINTKNIIMVATK